MKATTKTRLILYFIYWKTALLFLLLLILQPAIAQEYSFRNPQRVFGSNLQTGSWYRFSDVKAGTDAYIRIDDMTSGITLTELDRTSDGYQDAFQPSLRIPARRDGYVEFSVFFVDAGTQNLQVQPDFAVSGIDVDGTTSGSRQLYEYVAFDMGGGYTDFDMVNGQLSIQQNGNLFTGKNATGVDNSGVDTSATAFMFTAITNNISSIIVRVGIDNNINSTQNRNASVYFKPFSYANSAVLPLAQAINFSGTEKEDGIYLLWQMATPAYVRTVILEKSVDGVNYDAIQEYVVQPAMGNGEKMNYKDPAFRLSPHNYYRLHILLKNGQQQFSNILSFPSQGNISGYALYPTIVTTTLGIRFEAEKAETASFELSDYSGNIVYRKKQRLEKGINNFSTELPANLAPGTYIATLKTPKQLYSRQVIIRR